MSRECPNGDSSGGRSGGGGGSRGENCCIPLSFDIALLTYSIVHF